MSKILLSFLLFGFFSCQSVKIKNDSYKTSSTHVELGSIGQDKKSIELKNDFEYKAFAKLENRIRLSIELVPFNKKTYKAYLKKKQFNQNLNTIDYNDTVSRKPELALVRLMDVAGYVAELNAVYNKDVFSLIRETKEIKIASSITALLSSDELNKIKQADSYYLINNQEKRYTIALFKQGKKIDTIDINSATIVAYRLSSFCWTSNHRGDWLIADLAEGTSTCKGNTYSEIKEKAENNLYKM